MKIELKDVVNLQFVDWRRNSGRVEIDDVLRSIHFEWIKDGDKHKCVVTKGLEHCIF